MFHKTAIMDRDMSANVYNYLQEYFLTLLINMKAMPVKLKQAFRMVRKMVTWSSLPFHVCRKSEALTF